VADGPDEIDGYDSSNDCPACYGTGVSNRPEHFSVVRACGECHGAGVVSHDR
jgi:DnaJ-class molecular chaperone